MRSTRPPGLDQESGDEAHGDNGTDLLAVLGGTSNDRRGRPVASRGCAGANGRENDNRGRRGLGRRGGRRRSHDDRCGNGRGRDLSSGHRLIGRLGPNRCLRSSGGGSRQSARGGSGHDGGNSTGSRAGHGAGDGAGHGSRNSTGDGSRDGSRESVAGRDSSHGGRVNWHGADGCCGRDNHSGDVRTSRAVGHGRSTADEGLDLSLSDSAGGPGVRSLGLAVARVDIVPLVVVVVVTAVHGNVVRRVPDVDAASRRALCRAIISVDGDAKGKLDIKTQAEVGLDQVADLEAEVKGGASLVSRSNGGDSRNSNDRLHF